MIIHSKIELAGYHLIREDYLEGSVNEQLQYYLWEQSPHDVFQRIDLGTGLGEPKCRLRVFQAHKSFAGEIYLEKAVNGDIAIGE